MGRISTSPRYVIDITELNLLSLGELRGVDLEKIGKIEVFSTSERLTGS